ncbi:hypothetical protein C8F01DRAFT_1272423 [Mycena amicta]|nr:hypothetical protein C8F01DRAFT_1272423 [Mycena amicta]
MILVCTLLLFACCVVWLQFHFKRPPTWIRELNLLGRRAKHTIPGTVVICGGSVAGVLAARICSDHFESIVVVDPEIEDPDKPRTRIVQSDALHVYLALFVAGAQRLWPDLEAEVEKAKGRMVANNLELHYSGLAPLVPEKEYGGSLPLTFGMRRSAMQKLLHRLLLKTMARAGNVSVVAGTVRGVVPTEDLSSLKSVRIRLPDGSEKMLDNVALVVDCTGRTQAGLKWLQSAGYSIPNTIRQSYDPNLAYVTNVKAYCPISISHMTRPARAFSRFCLLKITLLIFGDTSTNAVGELPRRPEDIVPFILKFRGMNAPMPNWVIELVEILIEHDPSPACNVLHLTPLQYLSYHTLPPNALPTNYIALGDATVFLNPIHAQGFGKAMLNTIVLNSLLHSVTSLSTVLPSGFGHRYLADSAKHAHALWDATRLHDYGSISCKPMAGETKDTGRIVRWLEKKLLSAALYDEEVASALWHIRHMLAAETLLLAPSVLVTVLCARTRDTTTVYVFLSEHYTNFGVEYELDMDTPQRFFLDSRKD